MSSSLWDLKFFNSLVMHLLSYSLLYNSIAINLSSKLMEVGTDQPSSSDKGGHYHLVLKDQLLQQGVEELPLPHIAEPGMAATTLLLAWSLMMSLLSMCCNSLSVCRSLWVW